MKLEIAKVVSQIYIVPYIKITYDKFLNGNYEFIIGWLNYQIIVLIE
jgi:hypothetical protein